MKAKSRKHLLISSIAMLLVATVALGAATYAWFTQSPNANAEGLQVKATASNGLKVLSETHATAGSLDTADPTTYVTTTYLNATNNSGAVASSTTSFNLTPASLDVTNASMNAYTTSAESADAAAADADAAVTLASKGHTGDEMVYNEKIYCALIGADSADATVELTLNSLNVTTTNANMADAIRVALVYYNGTTSTVIGAYAPSATDESKILTGEAETYSAVTSSTYDYIAFASANDTSLGDVTTTGNCYLDVYVYIDGEASSAYSANIQASDLIQSIDIDLSIPTT